MSPPAISIMMVMMIITARALAAVRGQGFNIKGKALMQFMVLMINLKVE